MLVLGGGACHCALHLQSIPGQWLAELAISRRGVLALVCAPSVASRVIRDSISINLKLVS